MMSEPKRYDVSAVEMLEMEDGCYVLFSEYDRLRAENAALRAKMAELNHALVIREENHRLNTSEIETLRAKLATMVCGECKGSGFVFETGMFNGIPPSHPCPTCQPKEGT